MAASFAQSADESEVRDEVEEGVADEHALALDAELRVDRFVIDGEVARGGMGVIHGAREEGIERRVVLKTILPERQGQAEAVERFLSEARVTGQLEHPGVVPVYHLGQDLVGRPYYVMRRIEGETLAAVLSGLGGADSEIHKQYPLNGLLNIFQKVCDTVSYAHSRGVVHRDLKPSNIMIGSFGEVLVMDWGLAKRGGSGVETGRAGEMEETRENAASNQASAPCERPTSLLGLGLVQTMVDTVLGTPGFMAPEQAAGRSKHADERTDIFSLGAILYAILTLRAPIEADTVDTALVRTRSGAIRPPLEWGASERHVPLALSAVAMKALSTRPEDRYQTVAELQAEITAYQGGLATRAEHAGLNRLLLLWLVRHKTLSIAGLVLMVLAATFTWRINHTLERLRATAPTFYALAQNQLTSRQWNEALASVRQALALAPENARFRLLEGHILQARIELAEARFSYGEALRLEPSLASARLNLELCERLLAGEGDRLEELYRSLLDQRRSAEAVAVAQAMGIVRERSLNKWRAHLVGTGFPGELSLGTDGELQLVARRLRVGDLAALRGIPVARLDLSFNPIVDISVLKGMPLRWLDLQSTLVTDLSPLRNLPLEDLNLSNTKVTTFAELKGVGLLHLIAQSLALQDLTPLQGMRLRYLNLYDCRGVSDISPLAGMPLGILDLYHTRVSDLSPLRGMPLSQINLSATQVSDISPLESLPLSSLELAETRIADLRPLRGMGLKLLHLGGTPVSDLKPIEGMPLNTLILHLCPALIDLSPLGWCHSLERLLLPPRTRNVEVLRGHPALRKISSEGLARGWDVVSSADEFWRVHDGSRGE